MAQSFASQLTLVHSCTQTLTTTEQPLISTDNTIGSTLSGSRTSGAGTTPAVTGCAAMNVTLSTGTATVTLSTLTDIAGKAISFSGKKLREVSFTNPVTNANQIQIKEGASNGHPLFGAAWSIILQPGEVFAAKLVDSGQTVVAGADLTWDLVGTGSQILVIQLSAG